jgi:hypothetical protein
VCRGSLSVNHLHHLHPCRNVAPSANPNHEADENPQNTTVVLAYPPNAGGGGGLCREAACDSLVWAEAMNASISSGEGKALFGIM